VSLVPGGRRTPRWFYEASAPPKLNADGEAKAITLNEMTTLLRALVGQTATSESAKSRFDGLGICDSLKPDGSAHSPKWASNSIGGVDVVSCATGR
jgi:hypothetical protein